MLLDKQTLMIYWRLSALVLLACLVACSREEAESNRSSLAVTQYARHLLDEDAVSRREAFRALADYGPDAAPAIPALIGALGNEDPVIKRSATEVLGSIGEPAVAPLILVLNESIDPGQMKSYAEALGEIGPPAEQALPDLAESLQDYYPEVRAAAAIAMGKIAHGKKKPIVKRELRIQNQDVADLAKMVVGKEGSEGGLSKLKANIRTEEDKGETRETLNLFGVNDQVIGGRLPDEKESEVVIELGWGNNKNIDIDVVEKLMRAAERDEDFQVRAAAAQGLGHIGPEAQRAVPLLARLLWVRDAPTQRNAAWALGEVALPGSEGEKALRRALTGGDDELQKIARGSLMKIKER